MIENLRKALGKQADLVLVLGVVGILAVLFSPIPSPLLDLLLLANFSFAMLILLLTFYVPKPVEFSTFPSLLLVATLFRLSLNVAATRLILSDADAGKVIGAVGSYVVGGNYVIGLIVFLILVVVQYVVVTSGAQRVSEVAARFTLDSMPGQQMSIDADLNMGFIDQAEAMRRRRMLEKEAGFYGSMDGASKFVKGDAIAGILILLINIIGGLIIGVMQMGMGWGQALQTFTLLTIGDGIVTQVPGLVIAVGTGIIVTRSSADGTLSTEVFRQITGYPKTLLLVCAALSVLVLMPGIPALPGLALIALLLAVAYMASKRTLRAQAEAAEPSPETAAAADDIDKVYDALTVDPIEVRVGASLGAMVGEGPGGFLDRVAGFRKQYALESGFVAPKLRFRTEPSLADGRYELRIFGSMVASGEIMSGHTLAIYSGGEKRALPGIETQDPTYGLPAFWIEPEHREQARTARYTLVDGETVLLTHLTEVLRQQSAALLTRAQTSAMLDRVRKTQPSLVDELVPGVLSLSEVQRVLQDLLREKVSVRNLELILEVLVDTGRTQKDPSALTEQVRQRLSASICEPLVATTGYMHVLTLDPAVEQGLARLLRASAAAGSATGLALEPRFAEQLLSAATQQVEKMMKSSMVPVLLCAPELRRHLRALTERILPHLRILAITEVPGTVNLKSFGTVGHGLNAGNL
jgi:flagellar biosynthesis protein FlhA